MPQATFTADTRPLNRDMDEAVRKIRGVKTESEEAGRALKAAGSQFDGTKIEGAALRAARAIDKVGGATKLTDAELKKVQRAADEATVKLTRMGATPSSALQKLNNDLLHARATLGLIDTDAQRAGRSLANAATQAANVSRIPTASQGASAFASGLGIGVGAGVGVAVLQAAGQMLRTFTVDAIAAAETVQDLSDKTGISVEGIQRLGYAAVKGGTSVETLTGAVLKLSDRLVEGGSGTVAAVGQLGLKLSDLQEMQPEQAFLAIARGIAQIPDPMRQAQLAIELFGRSGAELLPAIRQNIDELAAAAPILAKEQIAALDRVGDAWETLVLRTKAGAAGMLADYADIAAGMWQLYTEAAEATNMPTPARLLNMLPTPSGGPSRPDAFAFEEWARQFALRQIRGALPPVLPDAPASPLSATGLPGAPNDAQMKTAEARVEAQERAHTANIARLKREQAETKRTTAEEEKRRKEAERLEAVWQRMMRPTLGVNSDLRNFGPLGGDRSMVGGISGALQPGMGFGDAVIPSTNPLNAILGNQYTRMTSGLTPAVQQTRDWRIELNGVAQAFAQMAQAAGPALDGVTRSAGVMLTSANAAEELSRALKMVDERGNLTRGGQALAGGMAGLTTGLQLGSLTQSRVGGGIMGGIGGGAAGWLATGTGVGLGVGLAAGAIGGIYAAHQNKKAQQAQMQQLREDAITAAGGLEELQAQAVRAGFSVEEFMRRFQSSDPQVFAGVINDMNRALAEQRTRAQELTTALDGVAAAQGVISQQQMAQIRNTDPEGDGAEAVVAFIEGQRQQTLAGILRAAAALERMASLTDEELGRLTEGVTDGEERARIIANALRDRAGSVMADLRAGVQATASAIFVAINDALQSGERLVDVLAVLAPAIETVKNLFERSGQAPGAGFAQVESYQRIATGPQTGPALELATGLGQALAGMANTGLLSPELFAEIANGIGAAYKQMELLGQGGLDAARLMQPALQAIWQQVQDFPGFEDTLDADTRALLDFAEQSGLVGDKFRPAIDRMIQAVDRLIERFDEFLARMAELAGMPPITIDVNENRTTTGPEPGDPGAPSDTSLPPSERGFTSGTGGLTDFGVNGTPVTLHGREAVLTAGQYTAMKAMAGARLASSSPMLSRGGDQTIVVELDGYEITRAQTSKQPSYLRVRGAA